MVNVYEIRPGSYATVAEAKEGGSESDVTKEYVDAGLATKQDQLTAGANITIVENVISATGELASTEWGEIGGSMSDQTDLTNALDAKASASDVAGLTTRVGDAETAIAGLDASKMDKVTLATVATSGSYNDLTNKPTIPDVSGLASVTYVDSEIDGVEAQIPDVSGLATKTEVTTGLAGKQDTLVSGTNIKTINGTSVLGSGDVEVEGVPDTTGASAGDVLTFDGTDVGWAAGGGSAPSNMVTTDTAQTITGVKTVDNTLDFGRVTITSEASATTHYLQRIVGVSHPAKPNAAMVEVRAEGTTSSSYGGRIRLIGSGVINGTPANANLIVGTFTRTGFANAWVSGVYTTQTPMVNDTVANGLVRMVDFESLNLRTPEFTITGDGTTSTFTVTHSLGKMPGIVQVTDSNGVVIKDSEITITKTTTNVSVTFTTAPAADATYTVAMLY